MKKKRKQRVIQIFVVLMVLLLLLSLFAPIIGIAEEKSEDLNLYAESAYLLNNETGEVLYKDSEDKKQSIDNLSLLMTTYILIKDIEDKKIDLKDKADISEKAWKAGEPRMFLEIGRTVTVQKLLEGLTIASGNDAAITTAEFISGNTEKFVKRMNKEALDLGMKNTEFSTPNGSSNDVSTAKDIALLTKEIVDKYPKYLDYFTMNEMEYDTRPGKTVVLKNQNNFVSGYEYSKGLKSGYSSNRYHLATYINKNGMKFIAITIGSSTSSKRTEDINNLLQFGFNQYQVINIARAGEKYSDFKVYKSTTPGPEEVVYGDKLNVVTRTGVLEEELELVYDGDDYIKGGTKKGEKVGTVKVYFENKLLGETYITTTKDFKKTHGFNAFLDNIALVFKKLIDLI